MKVDSPLLVQATVLGVGFSHFSVTMPVFGHPQRPIRKVPTFEGYITTGQIFSVIINPMGRKVVILCGASRIDSVYLL
jgi:hypothetical protein